MMIRVVYKSVSKKYRWHRLRARYKYSTTIDDVSLLSWFVGCILVVVRCSIYCSSLPFIITAAVCSKNETSHRQSGPDRLLRFHLQTVEPSGEVQTETHHIRKKNRNTSK